MQDLAVGNMTREEIARKYNRDVSTIDHFKARHRDTINKLAAEAMEYLDAAWVADKANRIAVYEGHIELVEDALAQVDIEDISKPAVRGETPQVPELLNASHRALRAVSEELGQLPTRA